MSTKDPLPHGMVSLPPSAYKPAPVSWKGPPGESCIVDKVLLTNNDDGHTVIKAWPRHPLMAGLLLLRLPCTQEATACSTCLCQL